MKKGFLNTILRSSKTVFSSKDLLLMWGGIDIKTAKSRMNYYAKTGDLYRIRRGLYAKDTSYDRFELATKVFTPAYVSFETVLGATGITFQYYNRIFVASYQSKEITADGQKYVFRTLKDSILTNSSGIENKERYYIASPERAFLDVIYLSGDYYFDNLTPINWDTVYKILPIYENDKKMKNRVDACYLSYKGQSE